MFANTELSFRNKKLFKMNAILISIVNYTEHDH